MTERERRLLVDRAHAAYTRLHSAIYAHGEMQEELLEEHATITDYVLRALKMNRRRSGETES